MGRLVRLETENFKSYKGCQTIGPFHKFTSVIGPNGSGKSNLMDVISFVLGVNSSHLRSQNLKDMIYRPSALEDGLTTTSTIAETGHTPRRAHVMLVYENARGQEIRFKRTIYESQGQSEYAINDRKVSYAEYNAALEKENILVKAKNFLVFQGDVESVASQNANDLTRLIEQISGSWEFKEQYDQLKLAQERAVENSTHAFNRKRGVMSEIKQYKEQKREAEKFERLVKERQQLVVRYMLWKLYHVEARIAELEAQKDEKRMAADGAAGDQLHLEKEFKEARKKQALMHKERTANELNIKKLKKSLEQQRPEAIARNEKIAFLEKRLEQTTKTAERLKRDHDKQVQVLEGLQQSLKHIQKAAEAYEASLPETGLIKEPALNAEQVEEYERLKQQVSIRAVAENEQLENLRRQQRAQEEIVKRLASKLDELKTRQSQLQEDERQLLEDGTALTNEAQKLSDLLENRKRDLAALQEERRTIHEREVLLNEKLQETLTKLMEAKVDERESAKEAKFKESLATMKQIFPGVHGKLVDLCRPTQRKYEVAVATALGRNLDSIVVDDQKTAIDCIQYMRDQRIGTAMFLPLNTLTVAPINDRFRNYTRGARLVSDVVSCDSRYERVIQYACGNTLVCDTLQIAKKICYENNEDVRAVTLDGIVIHRNGLITGGQSGTDLQTRWQQHDVDALVRTKDKLLKELNSLSKSKRMGNAEEQAKSDCMGLESQLNVLKDEITTAERKLADCRNEYQYILNELQKGEAELAEANQRLNSSMASVTAAENYIFSIEDEIFADFCGRIGVSNIREYESMRFGLPDQVMEQRTQFAVQRSRIETQISFENEQLAELEERLRKLEQLYNEDTSELEQLRRGASAATERIQETKQKIKELEARVKEQTALEDEQRDVVVAQLRQELERKGKNVEAYLKEVAKVEAEAEKAEAERVSLFRKCKLEDIELPLSRGSMEDIIIDEGSMTQQSGTSSMDVDDPSQMSIASTAWTVEVDYDNNLPDELRQDGSVERDKEFREELKRRADEIDKMAPNLKAIDRLEGVEQRLREVEESFENARRAAKKAKNDFEKVKQQRYKRFYDAFSHISERIDQVYKDLTKSETFPLGGTAYLSLEDSDEPYLHGITYHAMPPMKRFRDMDQLSGGEKSIAALALLFAIHSYQPSPFFVLDEVDAALDNTNVVKIANYIRKHASETFQFIVISLKNSLYEKAQSLVGIYRDQEAHSSKTLTLMLEPYQD